MNTVLPTINFDRINEKTFNVYYSKQVLIGRLQQEESTWVFYPEGTDALGKHTLTAITQKLLVLNKPCGSMKRQMATGAAKFLDDNGHANPAYNAACRQSDATAAISHHASVPAAQSNALLLVPSEANEPISKYGFAICCYSQCKKKFEKHRVSQTACSTRCRNRAWWERKNASAAIALKQSEQQVLPPTDVQKQFPD